MAHSCLFTFNLCYAVPLKRSLRSQILKTCFVHIHKHAPLKQQYEATEKGAQENFMHESEEQDSHKDTTNLELLKNNILKTSLTYVPEYGWSEKSIALGAKALGISTAAHTLIQGGGPELVHYFNFACNSKLEDYMKEMKSRNEKIDLRDFLTDALENRLRMIIPYLPKWPEAMALMAIPTQIPDHTKNVLDLVDSIWHFYGDTHIDMSWYSKRLSLAVAYKTAELSLIQDKSGDFSNTFEFLERRVENVIEAGNFVDSVSENGKNLLEFGSGAFVTVRNLLGLNNWFR